jgi:hypothetical protein
MTAIDPATCWVPVPVRWRYVQPGDVTVGLGGSLVPIVDTALNLGGVDVDYVADGFTRMATGLDPDEMVSVLVPIPERDAGALTVEQLGAVVIGRRTAGAA